MELNIGSYTLRIQNGGLEVCKEDSLLYFNHRPLFVTVKTAAAISAFYDAPYTQAACRDGILVAEGSVTVPSGSMFWFEDTYAAIGDAFHVSRCVTVMKAAGDLGFSTKFSLLMTASNETADYECFAPGCWYRHNEYAPENIMGKDLDCEYFWQKETRFALPLFAMRHEKSGETISLSRWAADITLRDTGILASENSVDPRYTIGAIGMSKPQQQTLNYLYYGYAVRTDIATPVDGLGIDYMYPSADGQMPSQHHYGGLDFQNKIKTFERLNHPVTEGFSQQYAVAVNLDCYDAFQPMMRAVWRTTYARLRDKLFTVDNEKHYHNLMAILSRYTLRIDDAIGLPFACQLPNMDISSMSFQFGFVGQQPGIGYHLLRYGDIENKPEDYQKGFDLIDFWVRIGMTDQGLPISCYNPNTRSAEPYPFYLRMMADGLEAILDAYVYLQNKGIPQPHWLAFCQKSAAWLIKVQNEDGSYYRAYHEDGSVRMHSKSNTPSIIRFLVQYALVTDDKAAHHAAVKAGDWTLANPVQTLEYRGGTCDNADIQDKEAGIYALFGLLSLYDIDGNDCWLQGAIQAADYTETWTYMWQFPIETPWPHHPFNQYGISGQSIITVNGGADVYMAACAYVYYRLYLITGDVHYRDFAEFIHCNTRQSNDIDGTSGYAMPGLGHESANFTAQTLHSHYHWLPWCTYVEADPSARLFDTFGSYDIAGCEALPTVEKTRRNRIYDHYFK